MLPWIAFIPESIITAFAAGDDMSDIQFLAIKEFQGKMRKQGETDPTTNEGTRDMQGRIIRVTAATGKDLYLARAKCVLFNDSSGNNLNSQVDLVVDDVVVESARHSTGDSNSMEYEFKNIGWKVGPGQDIDINIAQLDGGNVSVVAVLECWEEDTGTTPQIRPLQPL